MTDPAPFLSTIAASSAAMVAIIGGLLVARFVTLQSEQEGAQRVLDDAEARLGKARDRATEAADRWYDWRVGEFFGRDVRDAIGKGTTDIAALRRIGGWTSLSDEELQRAIDVCTSEFAAARTALSALDLTGARRTAKGWDEFRDSTPQLTEILWDSVWEACYIELLVPPQPPSQIFGGMDFPIIPPIRDSGLVAIEARRRDARKADVDRTQQQVEDLEGEVLRLKQAHDRIARPKGLAWALVILALFTGAGVIYPIWLMSRAPKDLTHDMGVTVFWLFCGGLVVLLGYMGVLALRLSGVGRRAERKSGV